MRFNFLETEKEGFTIYCYTACINCEKVKGILRTQPVKSKHIDCDLYVEDSFHRVEVLEFIKQLCGYPNRMSPMIFKDDEFVGSFWKLYDILNDFDSEDFSNSEDFSKSFLCTVNYLINLKDLPKNIKDIICIEIQILLKYID